VLTSIAIFIIAVYEAYLLFVKNYCLEESTNVFQTKYIRFDGLFLKSKEL